MSTRRKPVPVNNQVKALRKLGLFTDLKLNKTLSDKDKAAVRRQYAKYEDIISAPKDSFITKDVSHWDAKDKKDLTNNGYRIIKGKVYVEKQGYDKVSIKRTSPVLGSGFVEINRGDKTGRKTETEYIANPKAKMSWRDRLLEQYTHGGFQKGDFIGLKLFENGHFRRTIYKSIDDIFKYAEFDMTANDGSKRTTEYLRNNLMLVKISVKDYRDIGLSEKTQKTKNSESYQRSKKRKQLRGKVKRK